VPALQDYTAVLGNFSGFPEREVVEEEQHTRRECGEAEKGDPQPLSLKYHPVSSQLSANTEPTPRRSLPARKDGDEKR